MARLDDERLKDEVTYFVLQCVMKHEEAVRELKRQLNSFSVPPSSAMRTVVATSVMLTIVAQQFPTGKVQLGRIKPRELRRGMVAALEHCSSCLMSQACGADNSGAMNSTDSMNRTFAAIEMSVHANFVQEWTTKL